MAGNASNWHKVTAGPLKGQRVYVNRQAITAFLGQARMSVPPNFLQLVQQGDSWAHGILDMTDAAPTGQAKARVRAAPAPVMPAPAPVAAPRPTVPRSVASVKASGKPLTAKAAEAAFQAGLRDEGDASWTKEVGVTGLSGVYRAMGYHGKPQVVSAAQLDRYVAAGEREIFRGASGTAASPDTYSEAFRSAPTHYAGTGIYGNGTYLASNVNVASGYALTGSHAGTVLRMTIKADAKIGEYAVIEQQRRIDWAKAAAPHKALFDERDRLDAEAATTPRGTPAFTALIARRVANSERIQREAPLNVYSDTGAYAAAKGYDGYRVPREASVGGDYFVLLNRGAVRVQDTSLPPT